MPPRKLERTSAAIFSRAAQRGNDALFGLSADHPQVIELDLDRIRRNPDQPRRHFDEQALQELAASIERHGLKQPILAQEITEGEGQGDFLLVAGERRCRAHEMLGRKTIYAILTQGDPDELALIENIQRVDLDVLELARAFSRLIEKHGYTHETLGGIVGRSQSDVSRTLSILKLPEEILAEYETVYRQVPKSILWEIVACDDRTLQHQLWDTVKNGATVKGLREVRRTYRDAADEPPDESSKTPRPVGRPAPHPVRHLVSAARRIVKDLGATDPEAVRAHRQDLDEAQREDLRRLQALIAALLA